MPQRAMCLIAGLSMTCSTAFAAITYSAGQSEFTVGPGQKVVVPLFIDFDGNDATTLLSEKGLFSAGVSVAVTDSQPNGTPAQILALADITPNVAAFSDPGGPTIVYNNTLSAGILVLADAFGSAGVIGQPLGASGRRVLGGSIAFTAGPNVGEVTTVHISDFNANTSDTVTWESASELDAQIVKADFTIRVVPSPGTTVSLAAAGLTALRRRRDT